ncbi:MAG: protein phosphatase 2C domain-containing protein [Leptolyngbya sp. SIO1E4]|nr:protein phosphatase 2C domain-containing protein [Leptolyngbya sp. SIO1E4]
MTSAERVTSQTRVCLWALGPGAESVPVGQQVGDRYEVIAPQIWRDLTPETPPKTPESLPEAVVPYLKAHAHRVHVPGVYDVVPQRGKTPWILLENAPVNARSGQLYPALSEAWTAASSLRQMSWLWQIWQLWEPLRSLGVATSLLNLDNLRVEGWRVRVLQLVLDPQPPKIEALARCWQPLTTTAAESAIASPLANVCTAILAGEMSPEQLTVDLNYLFLKESAQRRHRFRMAGATHPGPRHSRNEDACYPEGEQAEIPTPRIAIVCDGVGGHEAGEVASHSAVRSLQLQLQGLLAESGQEENALPPSLIIQQIEAAIRVVNDLVNTQNDLQSRSDRQRMGTTLVMALLVPQRLRTPQGWLQVDELYLAHVGDSRAYWITPDYCHQLTVDDDIAGREAHVGRSFYTALRDRPDAGALTQALGTRSSQHLTPHVQRFALDEAGVLLLCSDGLSDHQRVETAWASYIGLITKDIISLQSAVDSWIELANQKNGHDNVSVVLMQAKSFSGKVYEAPTEAAAPPEDTAPQSELTDASKVLLYGEGDEEVDSPAPAPEPVETPQVATIPRWWVASVAVVIVLLAGFVGWWIAGQLTPSAPDPEADPEVVE